MGSQGRAHKDDHIRVVLWHGAGDSFAGNDIEPKQASELPGLHIVEFLAARVREVVPQVNRSMNRHVA
jgi:hypothetical protein